MGVFDLTCKLSGLSTAWPTREIESWDRATVAQRTCSMLLLMEVDGRQIPFSPPVSGIYDHYGRIELWSEHATPHARWVGRELSALWQKGALTSEFAADVQDLRTRSLGGDAAVFLAHAADSVFNSYAVRAFGARLLPCIYLDDVAAAVAASPFVRREPVEETFLAQLRKAPGDGATWLVYGDWLEEHARPLHAAYVRSHRANMLRGVFGTPPAESADVFERFHRVLGWVEARGGLRPIVPDDGAQHFDDEIRSFAHKAWDAGDVTVKRLIEGKRPDWAMPWRELAEASAPPAANAEPEPEAPVAKTYRPAERYTVGEVVTHKTFGLGRVEELLGPGKMRVRFVHEVKVLVHAG